MPNGRPRDLAVSALNEVGFATAGTGARLPQPVSLLMASTWDLTGTTRLFSRDDATARGLRGPSHRIAPCRIFCRRCAASVRIVIARRGSTLSSPGRTRGASSAVAMTRRFRVASGGRRARTGHLGHLHDRFPRPRRAAAGQQLCRMQRPPLRRSRTADLRAQRRSRAALAPRLHQSASGSLRNRPARSDSGPEPFGQRGSAARGRRRRRRPHCPGRPEGWQRGDRTRSREFSRYCMADAGQLCHSRLQ
jgi:hypothetical protein